MKIPKSEYEVIVAAYKSGESQVAIAARYHVSHVAIGRILKKLNHPTRMGSSKFYQEEIKFNHNYIIEAAQEGYSCIQIAEDLGIKDSTVNWVLKKAGILPTQEKELSQAFLSKIASSYKFGLAIADIKKRFGCSEGTVYYALKQHKVEVRPRGYVQKIKGKSNAMLFVELLELGYSIEEIANKLNFCERHILNMLKKHFPEALLNMPEKRKKFTVIDGQIVCRPQIEILIEKHLKKFM